MLSSTTVMCTTKKGALAVTGLKQPVKMRQLAMNGLSWSNPSSYQCYQDSAHKVVM